MYVRKKIIAPEFSNILSNGEPPVPVYESTRAIVENISDSASSENLILPPISSDNPLRKDLFLRHLRHNHPPLGPDSSNFHGSFPQITLDNMLYPSHTSFLQDIFNAGISVLYLLGIIWTLFLPRISIFFKRIKLLGSLLHSWCWSHFPVGLFLTTVILCDTCYRRNPRKIYSLKQYPRRWMIFSSLMIDFSRGYHPATLVLDFRFLLDVSHQWASLSHPRGMVTGLCL